MKKKQRISGHSNAASKIGQKVSLLSSVFIHFSLLIKIFSVDAPDIPTH